MTLVFAKKTLCLQFVNYSGASHGIEKAPSHGLDASHEDIGIQFP
jgi:hypothetical protein